MATAPAITVEQTVYVLTATQSTPQISVSSTDTTVLVTETAAIITATQTTNTVEIIPNGIVAVRAASSATVDVFSGNGTQTNFLLSSTPLGPDFVEVIVGGVTQTPTMSYTATTSTVVFSQAPFTGTDNVMVIYYDVLVGQNIVGDTGPTGPSGPSTWAGITDKNNANGPETVAVGVLANGGFRTVTFGYTAGRFSQGDYGIAIGSGAGNQSQSVNGIAIGSNSGALYQGTNAVAIGNLAGYTNQAANSIILNATGSELNTTTANSFIVKPVRATTTTNILYYNTSTGEISYGAGTTTWATLGDKNNANGPTRIALGQYAGATNQEDQTIAIGYVAGSNDQKSSGTAIGAFAAQNTQSNFATAIGYAAGRYSQQDGATAIGALAGNKNQGPGSTAIGNVAGYENQGTYTTAIGYAAASENQGSYSTAIGNQAGRSNQGSSSVAIGTNAGFQDQHTATIILNATGVALNSTSTSSFYVKPIRQVVNGSLPSGFYNMAYNTTTGEIIYWT